MTALPIGSLWAEIADAYQDGIVDAGRQPELLFLVAFLLTFAFIRTSTHMIRRGVSWWPGNVEVKGTHIHHLVWGILLVLVVGYLGIALEPASPWHEILAVLFGIGAALTLDEFALWLNLRDVYWSAEGRRSIDAVIVTAVLAGFAVLGFGAWVDLARDVEVFVQAVVAGAGVAGIALAIVNGLKGKFFTALATLFVPPVGVVGAIRLARPGSVWTRLYSDARLTRAKERFPTPDGRRGRRGASATTGAPLPADGHERDQPRDLGGDRAQ